MSSSNDIIYSISCSDVSFSNLTENCTFLRNSKYLNEDLINYDASGREI